jgi:hypothetical protein
MLRDALLVAGKDLRLEARSRVATTQVAPFAVLVLVLFAFAPAVCSPGWPPGCSGWRWCSPPC